MSRYNHFSKHEYEQIDFCELKVGDKFRIDLFDGKRRRSDIVMVKTGDLAAKEFKSGKERKYYQSAFTVSQYEKPEIV